MVETTAGPSMTSRSRKSMTSVGSGAARASSMLSRTVNPSATPTSPVGPPSPAAATLYAPPSTAGAIARLLVRHGDGSTEQHLIRALPFVIGREPDAQAGLTLRDPACRASREHLRLGKLQGSSILTENLAASKGGT